MLSSLIAFLLGAALALYTTPLMRRAALQFGIVDRPDGILKKHGEPVPYLGGLAVFVAYLIALALICDFSHTVLGILLSSTLVLLVGLIDDLGALSPSEKFISQCLAVAVLLKAGLYVKLAFLPEPVSFALSVFWMLTLINAVNVIDVMDGLATGVAAIAAICLALLALVNGRPTVAVMAAALAGSLCGFLRYNFSPARIYLGDAGSLFIGLTLAALAMNGGYTQRNLLAMVAPVIILGVPLFDLAFVSYIRWERGLSPFRGSPDHFALRLKRAGLSVHRVTLLTYACGVVLSVGAFAVMYAPSEMAAVGILIAMAWAALVCAARLRRIEA